MQINLIILYCKEVGYQLLAIFFKKIYFIVIYNFIDQIYDIFLASKGNFEHNDKKYMSKSQNTNLYQIMVILEIF